MMRKQIFTTLSVLALICALAVNAMAQTVKVVDSKDGATLYSTANEWTALSDEDGTLVVKDNKNTFTFELNAGEVKFLGLQKGFTGQLKIDSFVSAVVEVCGHVNTQLISREPTCTLEGFTWLYCHDCQSYIEEITWIPALGHHCDGIFDELIFNEEDGKYYLIDYCERFDECGYYEFQELDADDLLGLFNAAIAANDCFSGDGFVELYVLGFTFTFVTNSGNGQSTTFGTYGGQDFRVARQGNPGVITGAYFN